MCAFRSETNARSVLLFVWVLIDRHTKFAGAKFHYSCLYHFRFEVFPDASENRSMDLRLMSCFLDEETSTLCPMPETWMTTSPLLLQLSCCILCTLTFRLTAIGRSDWWFGDLNLWHLSG